MVSVGFVTASHSECCREVYSVVHNYHGGVKSYRQYREENSDFRILIIKAIKICGLIHSPLKAGSSLQMSSVQFLLPLKQDITVSDREKEILTSTS